MHEGSRKAIIAAFLANLGIAIAKFAGFLITGSAGLLAEAMHSLADTGNQAPADVRVQARQAPRPTRPTRSATGPERYFWAFVVALVLFSIGGLFALYEGIEKLLHPHEVENPSSPSSSSASPSCWRAGRCAPRSSESRHVRTAGSERGGGSSAPTKSPELPVVLLEDIGARDRPGLRPHRPDPRRGHRRPAVGRRRLDRHRPAPRRHRHHPGDRDEGAADRRVGHRGRPRDDRARRSPSPTSCSGSSTCAPCTSVPTTCCWRPRSSSTTAWTTPALAKAIDEAERCAARRGADHHDGLHRARHPPAAAPTP